MIAKRRLRRGGIRTARIVYEEILPYLPVSGLKYFGFLENPEDQFCWLFLGDAGSEMYSPRDSEHRAIAGRAVGLLHTYGARIPQSASLPDRGASHYLHHLQCGRGELLQNLSRIAEGSDRMLINTLAGQLDLLEGRWTQIEKFCKLMPSTLVHGDLVVKNVRVQRNGDGLNLLMFDWDEAGWGIPAPDLVQSVSRSLSPDLSSYLSVVSESWPHLDTDQLECFSLLGTIFRLLAAINWESSSLEYPENENSLENMRIYSSHLATSMAAWRWEP